MIISNESSADVDTPVGNWGRVLPKTLGSTPAQRVAKLREVLGYETQTSFAAFLGVDYGRYNHVERGMPLSYRLATIIARKCPMVSPEWLMEGDPTRLTPDWFKRLSEPLKESRRGE